MGNENKPPAPWSPAAVRALSDHVRHLPAARRKEERERIGREAARITAAQGRAWVIEPVVVAAIRGVPDPTDDQLGRYYSLHKKPKGVRDGQSFID